MACDHRVDEPNMSRKNGHIRARPSPAGRHDGCESPAQGKAVAPDGIVSAGPPLSLGRLGITSEQIATALSRIVTHTAGPQRKSRAQELALDGADQMWLRSMLDALPAPVYATDTDGFISYFNQAAEAFAGRRPVVGVDRWCITERLYSPDGSPLAREDCSMALALRENRAVRGTEAIAERPDGTRIPFAPFPTPIRDATGEIVGAVNVLLDISARKRAEMEAARLARHDALTGLPNRAAFHTTLDQLLARRAGGDLPFAVMRINVTGHTHISDMYGHATGDEALRAIALRLKKAVGKTPLFHIASDTFALVLARPRGRDDLRRFAETLCSAGNAGAGAAREAHSTIAIGCALFPTDGRDASTLLANAAGALLRARQTREDPLAFFDSNEDLAARDRQLLKSELREAIWDGALSLHFQPQLAADGMAVAFEALVRWNHPVRGMIAPVNFIPLAEEDGTIVEISEWILRSACREAASWQNPLRVAVNLSPLHFRSGDLPAAVQAILKETGLAPDRLELEITEGVMVQDFEQAMSMLRKLRDIGVRIALDDFGTGYSSLSYLQAFPLNTLKIDRSFTENLGRVEQSAAIIRSVVGLGHALGLEVAAEGVESKEQLDFLIAEGCDLVQGYFTGRPANIDSFTRLTGRNGAQRFVGPGLRSA